MDGREDHSAVRLALEHICACVSSVVYHPARPEAFRRAKFNDGDCHQLWPLLLDLVLVRLSGIPADSARTLHELWRQCHAEADSDDTPIEGVLQFRGDWMHSRQLLLLPTRLPATAGRQLAQDYLRVWGYPLALSLASPTPRQLLLAVGWLLADSRILEVASAAVPAGPLQRVLPPYAQDLSGQVYSEHVQRDAALAPPAGPKAEAWEAVQQQSHRTLRLQGQVLALQKHVHSLCTEQVALALDCADSKDPSGARSGNSTHRVRSRHLYS